MNAMSRSPISRVPLDQAGTEHAATSPTQPAPIVVTLMPTTYTSTTYLVGMTETTLPTLLSVLSTLRSTIKPLTTISAAQSPPPSPATPTSPSPSSSAADNVPASSTLSSFLVPQIVIKSTDLLSRTQVPNSQVWAYTVTTTITKTTVELDKFPSSILAISISPPWDTPNTGPYQYATVTTAPGRSEMQLMTPTLLPILTLTDEVIVLLNSAKSTVEVVTLTQPAPPQATITSMTSPPRHMTGGWKNWTSAERASLILGMFATIILVTLLCCGLLYEKKLRRKETPLRERKRAKELKLTGGRGGGGFGAMAECADSLPEEELAEEAKSQSGRLQELWQRSKAKLMRGISGKPEGEGLQRAARVEGKQQHGHVGEPVMKEQAKPWHMAAADVHTPAPIEDDDSLFKKLLRDVKRTR